MLQRISHTRSRLLIAAFVVAVFSTALAGLCWSLGWEILEPPPYDIPDELSWIERLEFGRPEPLSVEESVGVALVPRSGPWDGRLAPYLNSGAAEFLIDAYPDLSQMVQAGALAVLGMTSTNTAFVEEAVVRHMRDVEAPPVGVDRFYWFYIGEPAVVGGIWALAAMARADSRQADELLQHMATADYWKSRLGETYREDVCVTPMVLALIFLEYARGTYAYGARPDTRFYYAASEKLAEQGISLGVTEQDALMRLRTACSAHCIPYEGWARREIRLDRRRWEAEGTGFLERLANGEAVTGFPKSP